MMGEETGQISGTAGGARLLARAGRLRAPGAAMLAVVGALLVCSPPASALSQRGHVFGSSFGQAFKEKPSEPSAVAVDEATGDVYVLDSADNSVLRFGPEHSFIEAWGFGVESGAAAFQKCTKECKAGIAGFAKEQFDHPVAIAIDNAKESPSTGDVYVVANNSPSKTVIDKFGPTGELVGTLITKAEKEEVLGVIDGVAVAPSGTLWVEREDEESFFQLKSFNDEPANKLLETLEIEVPEPAERTRPTRPGFGVDSEGDLYVTYQPGGKDATELEEEEEEIAGREQERKEEHEPPANEQPQQPCEKGPCLVAKLALVHEGAGISGEPLIQELDSESSAGVGVDLSSGAQSSDDVYLDNSTGVAAFTSSGSLIQRFGSGQLHGANGLAVDAKTNEVLVADATTGLIDAYVPAPPESPEVEAGSVSASAVTSTSAELTASIDPRGALTRYRFQYGTASCETAPCSEEPAAPGTDIGAGYGNQSAAAHVAGLLPSTTYHVRVIAESPLAEGSKRVVSEEHAFTTQPAAAGATLLDGRTWELVSPAERHGASILPMSKEGGLIQSSANGHTVSYISDAPVGAEEPAGYLGPSPAQIISSRSEGAPGWSSRDISTENETSQGYDSGGRKEYQFFSSDLSLGLLEPQETAPLLDSGATEGAIYLRNNTTCAASPQTCYVPLVSAANDTAKSRIVHALSLEGATPDMRDVVFHSKVPLITGATGEGLYEWSGGRLRLVSVLPNGQQATGLFGLGDIGDETAGGAISSAASDEGSRVVWRTNSSFGEGHLYVRNLEKGETLQVDEPDTSAPVSGTEGEKPVFQGASADGSKVFFTDGAPLAGDSTVAEAENTESEQKQDLYVFEAARPAGERVTDLTPDTDVKSGERAGVLGGVLGISEEGSLVYFVAEGALAEGAEAGDCQSESPGAACNLYVEHFSAEKGQWEKPRLIARLSHEDHPDWGKTESGSNNYNVTYMTSRSSPNGEHLAFMSERSLTGYDNRDEKSGVPDEEVYLYSYNAGSPSLVCASCNPSGARPVGVHDIEESGEGYGLVVDRNEIWIEGVPGVDNWLAASLPAWTSITQTHEALYQSRYLLNDGRLFFNSSDALVPHDINGKDDVYEYEPKGVGSCETENTSGGCVALISSGESEQESDFLDASENGSDVFFLTSAKLSPLDTETGFVVYDARVCGTAPGAEGACPSPESAPVKPCSDETCQGAPPSPPAYPVPATATHSGAGNIVEQAQTLAAKTVAKPKKPTRAQELAKALKTCKKDKKKSKRLACEKQARKKYGGKASKARRSSAVRESTGRSSSRTRR